MTGRRFPFFQARPAAAARLFLLLSALCLAALVLTEAGEYLLSARRESVRLSADAPASPRLLPNGEGVEERRVSINEATLESLQQAPGIGPALAQAILDAREEIGSFAFWEELLDVPGIGQKRLDALAEYFYCPLPDPI